MAMDLSALDAAGTALYNQGVADGAANAGAPAPAGISADQEAADIAAAIKPLQDQIAALQLAKSDEDALLASVRSLAQQLAGLLPTPVAPQA